MQDDPSVVSLVHMMRHSHADYVFPECYFGEESEEKLIMELKLAALLEGFSLVIGSRKTPEQMEEKYTTTNRLLTIRLECEHHRVRRSSKRKSTDGCEQFHLELDYRFWGTAFGDRRNVRIVRAGTAFVITRVITYVTIKSARNETKFL